jgi:glycosyltransferase involved in cell wall biosynthesis
MTSQPAITVLMPVYNGATYVSDATRSVLDQSFRDFEFLIIDDGSTDDTPAIVSAFSDPRIRFLQNARNQGLTATLNDGLRMATGRYLARMDADDIAHPLRLETQLRYMQNHPDIAITGTWIRSFGAVKRPSVFRHPEKHEDIVARLLFGSAIFHPSAMFNMARMKSVDLTYDSQAIHAEYYDLWTRAAVNLKLGNVPEILLDYRIHAEQVSREHSASQKTTSDRIRRTLLEALGISFEPAEAVLHCRIADHDWEHTPSFHNRATAWLRKLQGGCRHLSPPLRMAVEAECLRRRLKLDKRLGGRFGLRSIASTLRVAYHRSLRHFLQ